LTKKKAVSQETLIKTLLKQKQPSIKQGLPVNKKTLLTAAFILALLLSAVAGAFFLSQHRQTLTAMSIRPLKFHRQQTQNHP